MGLIKGKPVTDDETVTPGADERPAFVPAGDETVDEDAAAIVVEGDENGAGAGSGGEGGEGGAGTGGEGEPAKPFLTFKTEEEYKAYIAKNNPAPTKPAEPAAPVAPVTTKTDDDEIAKLTFWEGYKDPDTGKWVGKAPADWNDFARTIIRHLDPKAQAPKILEEIRNMTAKEKKELQDIDAGYDAEFDELATQGLVPKRGTKEGDAANLAISTLGGEYGLTSMKKAYELWSKIPADKGGGLGFKPATDKKPNPSKEASRLIGSSTKNNAAGKPSGKIPYSKLHSARSVDDLLDE